MIKDETILALTPGQTQTYDHTITDTDVALFALLTRDQHPLHLDVAYASATRFGQRIVPVGLLQSLVEVAFAATIPGMQGFIRKQTTNIISTLPIDEHIVITITIVAIIPEDQRICCRATLTRDDESVVLTCDNELIIEPLPPMCMDDMLTA
jgi:3-hydroxybutyryl-CoA dehydratase